MLTMTWFRQCKSDEVEVFPTQAALIIILQRSMVDMEERRRSKRTDLHSRLLVKRIDTSGQEEIGVDVKNVSKTGIGFYCNEILDMGAVYEAYLTIWTKEVIHAFIEIVRIEKVVDTYEFGGLFIGMPEIDLQRIDVYNAVNDAENYNDK